MIYLYYCPKCHREFDVIKSVSEYKTPEKCELCETLAEKRIGRINLFRVNDWTESYNPAFGCVVKNKKHQREILAKYRDKGQTFEEVGNEPVENIHKYYDRQRAEKQAERWNEPTEKIIQEALR